MALDPQYLDAIKGFEGYAAQPAWDYKQNSSGYGTRAQAGDENIPPDQLKAVHEQRYQAEIEKAAAHVDSVNPNLPAGARAALVSLTYNAGPGWSQSGLGELVKAGDLQGAATRLLEYNKAGGEVNPGLVARRQKEAAWFNQQPQPAPASPAAPAIAPAAPMNIAPPASGLLSNVGGLLNANQQAQPSGGGLLTPDQPAQMPAIQFAQRRSPDLSKLKAAFKAPTFSRG